MADPFGGIGLKTEADPFGGIGLQERPSLLSQAGGVAKEIGQRMVAPVDVGFAAEGLQLPPETEAVAPEIAVDPFGLVGIPAQVFTERAGRALAGPEGTFTVGAGLDGIDLTGQMTPEAAGVVARLVTEATFPLQRFVRLFTARKSALRGPRIEVPEELQAAIGEPSPKITPTPEAEAVVGRDLGLPTSMEGMPSAEEIARQTAQRTGQVPRIRTLMNHGDGTATVQFTGGLVTKEQLREIFPKASILEKQRTLEQLAGTDIQTFEVSYSGPGSTKRMNAAMGSLEQSGLRQQRPENIVPIPSELLSLRDEMIVEKMTFLADNLEQTGEVARTGQLIPTEEGFRRVGGYKRLFPEIADLPESPGDMVKAIRSGKGKLYEKIKGRFAEMTDASEVEAAAKFMNDVDEMAMAGAGERKYPPIMGAENPPPRAANINLNRLETTDDVKRMIAEVAENNAAAIEESRRGVITFEQTRRLADDLGLTPEKLLKRRKGTAFNAEEALAARQIMTASAEDTWAMIAKARDGGDAARLDALRAMSRHIAIQKQVSGLTAEAGRALGSFRIGAAGAPARGRALKAMIEAVGGEERLTVEIMERIAQMDPASPTFIRDVNLFLRDVSEAKTSDKLFELWVNAILSGPQTHVVNTTSNTLTALSRPIIERPTAAAIDFFRATVKGTARERFFGETAADIFGMTKGLREGVRKGMEAFRTEIPTFGPTKLEVPIRAQQAIKGRLGRIVRIPGRALVGADEFMKAVNFQGELHALAYRQAAREGLKGASRAKRISEIIRNPSGELIEKATTEAFYRTFTKELGPVGKDLQRFRNHSPVIRYIVPFMRTPINIAKFGLERTPLNFLRLAYKARKGQMAGLELVDELAKPTMGSLIGAVIAGLAAEGLVTGGGPQDPAKRNVKRATGWKPYALKIGDQYYSYGRFEPLGMIMGLTADYVELFDATEKEDAVAKISLAISQNLSNKTFLRGLSDAVNAVSDPERYGNAWIEGFGGTVVPTGVAQLARGVDPTLRRPENVLETIQSRIPFLSYGVAPLRDIWGRPIVLRETGPERFVSPVRRGPVIRDKASMEVDRLDIRPGSPQRRLGKATLTRDEYETYVEQAGALAYRLVTAVVNSPRYDKLPDPVKAKLIKDAFTNSRTVARVKAKTEAIRRVRREEGPAGVREILSPLPQVPAR